MTSATAEPGGAEPGGGPTVPGVQVSFDAAVREHVRRRVAAGATLVAEHGETANWWIVLTEPEGNELCLQ